MSSNCEIILTSISSLMSWLNICWRNHCFMLRQKSTFLLFNKWNHLSLYWRINFVTLILTNCQVKSLYWANSPNIHFKIDEKRYLLGNNEISANNMEIVVKDRFYKVLPLFDILNDAFNFVIHYSIWVLWRLLYHTIEITDWNCF